MSQCHKCDKPCGHVLTFQIPSTLPYCVVGPVLEALPDASEEQIRIATAVFAGKYDLYEFDFGGARPIQLAEVTMLCEPDQPPTEGALKLKKCVRPRTQRDKEAPNA